MRVALLQTDIVWGDVCANIRNASLMVEQTQADLYVLPEMWSTGFSAHPEQLAEPEPQSEALSWMQLTAASRQCALCGSMAVRTVGGDYRNRHYLVSPDATIFYDKHHLFTYSHEDRHYQAGHTHTIATIGGLRCLLLVCYDLRFPVWARYGWAGLYDAIILVANWPSARQSAWEVLLRARAIENQCYVIGVNRVGQEHGISYVGGSVVVDPSGQPVAACGPGPCCCVADIEKTIVEQFRQRFPVLNDRDEIPAGGPEGG